MDTKNTFIYALCEPGTGKIRYVGKANDPAKRFSRHLRDSAKANNHLGNWLRTLKVIRTSPILEILDEVPESKWEFWEREYIRVFRAVGMSLVNSTDGGEGCYNPSIETRQKLSESKKGRLNPFFGAGEKNPFFGKNHSPETRQKISEAKKGHGQGKSLSPEHVEKIRGAKLGQPRSKETCEKISKALCGRKLSAAHVAAVTSALPRGSQHPAFGVPVSEEKRAAISAKLTGRRVSEEIKEKMRAAQLLRRSKEKESRGV